MWEAWKVLGDVCCGAIAVVVGGGGVAVHFTSLKAN
jgi:hypothetical protein